MTNIAKYLGLIGFLTWFIQTQKIFDKLNISLFQEIRKCRLCLGTWVALCLYPSMKIKTTEHPFDCLITSSLLSFFWYVFSHGWKSLFGLTEIK